MLTQAMVIKLILDHIGGSKITGNMAAVNVGGSLAIVKAGGMSSLAGLGSAVSSLAGSYGSVAAITSALQQNPLTSVVDTIASTQTALQAQFTAITNLPGAIGTSLTTSLSGLTSSLSSLTNHSNILSGLVLSTESIDSNALALTDLTSLGGVAMSSLGMTKEEVLASAGSLSSTGFLNTIADSININTPGGVTELVNELSAAASAGAEEAELTAISDQIVALIAEHQQSIDDMIDADLASQEDLKLRVDTLNTLATILPDPSNEIATAMFDLVATDEFRELNTTLAASANT
jgi:hypothetical protein